MRYFDAHAHVQFPVYDEDREVVLARMHAAEVGALVVGTNKESSAAALLLADGVTRFAAVGLHPNYVKEEWFEEAEYLRMAEHSHVVAIGECGLDFFRPEDVGEAKREQVRVFKDHAALALKVQKPLMVHARPSKGTDDAYEEALRVLAEYPGVRANFHFFVGSVAMALRIAEAGHTCSFTAVLTFTSDYDDVIRALPLASILSETDAPYVAPAPHRGKRNEPAAVVDVVHAIARIRGEEEGTVREALLANALRVFRLPAA
jgi:TatD DNase family protein